MAIVPGRIGIDRQAALNALKVPTACHSYRENIELRLLQYKQETVEYNIVMWTFDRVLRLPGFEYAMPGCSELVRSPTVGPAIVLSVKVSAPVLPLYV